jgi:hypothetical protein
MADTTLTSVPASTFAGDTFALKLSLTDYPATTWQMTLGFRSKDGVIDITSTPTGDDHLLAADSLTTASWLPGKYKGAGRVTDGTRVLTVWEGSMEVLASLIDATMAVDTRTPARICLDNLLLASQGKASRDILNTTIAGQSIGRMSWSEMTSAIAYWQDRVDAEVAAENAANGLGNSRNVLIRFGNA